MFFVMAYAPAETGGECWMQSKRSLMFDLARLKQGGFFFFFFCRGCTEDRTLLLLVSIFSTFLTATNYLIDLEIKPSK